MKNYFPPAGKIAAALELCANLAYLSVMLIVHVHVRVKADCIAAFKTPTLANAHGLREEHVADIAVKAANASSMKANPITLTPGELAQILRLAL